MVAQALLPGRDFKEQLRLIIELIGTPSSDEIDRIENNTVVQYIASLELQEPKALEVVLPNAARGALDLVRQMLCFDPTNRVTAQVSSVKTSHNTCVANTRARAAYLEDA